GAGHHRAPGMIVSESCFEYSSAAIVSGLLMTTLFLASTSLPPWPHTSQNVQFESPVALPSAKPGGVPLAFSAWHNLRKPAKSLGKASKPAALIWLWRPTRVAPAAPIMIATHLLSCWP